MNLTIEISDDIAVALKAQAEAEGLSAALYASRVIGKTIAPTVAHEIPVKPLAAGSRRDREMQWLSAHAVELAAHKGEWVVIEGECLLAHDPDYTVARKQAVAAGVNVPFIFFVPTGDDPFPSAW